MNGGAAAAGSSCGGWTELLVEGPSVKDWRRILILSFYSRFSYFALIFKDKHFKSDYYFFGIHIVAKCCIFLILTSLMKCNSEVLYFIIIISDF